MKDFTLASFSVGGKPVENLSRFTALCRILGEPQNDLNFIHIAGTNGKGSVSEYISRALVNEGYKTGKFTSPYVLNIRERIQFQNRFISNKDFNEVLKTTITAALQIENNNDYSQFEILTAAAFLYFKKKNTDVVVLETGIGGLLDCTNVVEPKLSVITAIGYDHSDILGSELSDIAAHKAGIIKDAPCVMYPVQERAAYVEIKKRTEIIGTQLIIPDLDAVTDEKVSIYGNTFSYKGDSYATIMGGRHQVLNAIVAIEALRLFNVSERNIKNGLKTAALPARMQIIRKNPLVILDGAHNRQGIVAAKEVFAPWHVRKAVVFGILGGKDYLGALQELSTFAHYLVLTDGFAPNAISCSDLYRASSLFGFEGGRVFTVSEPRRAVEIATELCGGGMVLVTGSIRLAASYLTDLFPI
ncbi:MAG: Mur ligase family protein [Oscillospiraceae bacterium]|nr:Mur ligase family protein [Oscillospiraceae bacterium]